MRCALPGLSPALAKAPSRLGASQPAFTQSTGAAYTWATPLPPRLPALRIEKLTLTALPSGRAARSDKAKCV